MSIRSENSYINNDVLPFLASNFGYPIHDPDRVKINDVPIFRPSGGRSGSTIDIAYYHNEEPVLMVEAKRDYKTHEKALAEVLYYLKNFPIDKKEFAPSGLPPKILATSVGKDIQFYKWSINIFKGIPEFIAEPIKILSFEKLVAYYNFDREQKPRLLNEKNFKTDFFDQLMLAYVKKGESITQNAIIDVSNQILTFLYFGKKYTGQYPYVDLDLQKQKAVRDLFNRFDLKGSVGQKIAQEFRKAVLRAFQGGGFNQYMTEQCIIDFMWNLVGKISPKSRVLDFECGSGGFLATAVAKNKLSIRNILGIDIDELPYTVAKTYIALYFLRESKKVIEKIILNENGLYNYGENWDVIISNPAGSNEYKLGNERRVLKEGLQNLTGKHKKFSEYELSIQQAVRSLRVGGKLCLILPEGFFANSHDEFLRKYVAKYCRILAMISLPRGVFKKGTSVKGVKGGSHIASMKMSILLAKKVKNVEHGVKLDNVVENLNYPIFFAGIDRPPSTLEDICDWLALKLNFVLGQWKIWQKK